MRNWLIIVICLFAQGLLYAQQDEPRMEASEEQRQYGIDRTRSGEELRRSDQGIFLPGFRDYLLTAEAEDIDLMQRCSGMLIMQAIDNLDDHPSSMQDHLLIRHNFGLHLRPLSAGPSLLEFVGQLLLSEAIQFGYAYAREKVREQSLTEMDYLYLPQGPGVIRSFNELSQEASYRGGMQAYRVWYDYYQARKNTPSAPTAKP